MRIVLVGPEEEENLSIRYLSSSLHAAGHEVDLASFNRADDMDSVVSAASKVDLVGLSMCFQSRAPEYLELARRIKKEYPARPVVAGGHYASCAAKDLLYRHPEIDLIVIHEGEQTLVEIAEAGTKLHQRLQQIKGIACRNGNDICFTEPRPIIEDLDSLPYPDRRGSVRLLAGVPTACMLGSRGCFGSCDYCCITTLHRLAPGKRFRQRSTESIADEMETLYNERGIRQFIFHDDNFLVPSVDKNHQHLDALGRALSNRRVEDIAFAIKCRPHEADREVFKKLQEMGLLRVYLGIESGSSIGLSSIGRKQTVADAERALEICEDLGISSQYIIMIFHPDATIDTMRTDIAFMREHIDHPQYFVRVETFAGTPLEQRLIEERRASGNYLARYYHLLDPAADLVCGIAKKHFLKRCWGDDNLTDFAAGMEHLSEIMKHFYRGKEVDALHKQIHAWWLNINRNSLDLLEGLVDICSSDPHQLHSSTHYKLKDLLEEEAYTSELFYTQGERLRQKLEALTLNMVGLRQMGTETIRIQSRQGTIARHAAAVMLALCVAGVVPSIGFSHEPPSPINIDSDKDGLCDVCETEIFGTNPKLADTDGDGIMDGDEDHDGDGLTNLAELNKTVALIDAVEIGDTENVKALLEYSSYMRVIDDDGMTPLIRAAYNGHTETVKFLLDSGAEVDAKDKIGRTGLMRALERANTETVKVLLDAGADVNAKDANGATALMIAASVNAETVKVLLDSGADVNAKMINSRTALMWAASSGNAETVKVLLDAGADVNVKDNDDMTPLIQAAYKGHTETVKVLLDAGANMNAKDNNGSTALMWAASSGNAETVKILLKADADVNAKNKYGSTVLMWAASSGNADIVKVLLDAGSDVNAKMANGDTSLKIATDKGFTEIIELLKKAGAKK
jgi:anaerobic magnesium-protoporphyrin IX monomethyl ester cyclase